MPRRFTEEEIRQKETLSRFGRFFSLDEVTGFLFQVFSTCPEMIISHSCRYIFLVDEGSFFLSSGKKPVLDFARFRSDPHKVFLRSDVFMVATDA
ncbi:MAG: hypothetical protein FJY91_02105 [Candidatus Harrisonbacteria bacterium]|nr:hypothetical protein [Candidatus Harrisonbacteria bacterium]